MSPDGAVRCFSDSGASVSQVLRRVFIRFRTAGQAYVGDLAS